MIWFLIGLIIGLSWGWNEIVPEKLEKPAKFVHAGMNNIRVVLVSAWKKVSKK